MTANEIAIGLTGGSHSPSHAENREIIFRPLRFRNLEVKNRLFRSSISGTFDDYNGNGSNARLHQEEK